MNEQNLKEENDTPGEQVVLATLRILDSLHIFHANYNELSEELSRLSFCGVQTSEFASLASSMLSGGMREVNRLALNYLGSAVAFHDHIKEQLHAKLKPIERSNAEQILSEYFKQRDEGPDSELHWFMVGLRNYAMHRSLPLALLKGTVQKDLTISLDIEINTQSLLQHISCWRLNKPGRGFLATLGESALAKPLFESHHTATIKLFMSLVSSIDIVFRKQLGDAELAIVITESEITKRT